MTKIIILHTGGTIASKVDYATGGVSNLTKPEELLAQYPELQQVAKVEARFIANMSSDDMRFAHWNLLIAAVEEVIGDYDGVIVTHGTDTLHYTAAALHYGLLGVPKPVVLVGSQRSSDRGSSDAAQNLMGAARFIAEGAPGVYLAMHATPSDDAIAIHHAVNARKMHSSRRDAFRSINRSPVAMVRGDRVEDFSLAKRAEFTPSRFKEDLRVGMAYAHPNMAPEELSCYEGFDALILLGTGLGHFPINDYDELTAPHKRIRETLGRLAKAMPVIMATQAIHGRVNLQVYSAGRRHVDLGILGHGLAYTPETLFVKAAWLLSQGLDVAEELGTEHGDAIERIPEDAYE